MVFLVRKMRLMPRLKSFKVVVVTDRTDLEGQLRDTARLSGETLRPNENDTARRESPTARTQRILRESTPDIVFAMLQKYQDGAQRDSAETVRYDHRAPGEDAGQRGTCGREDRHLRGKYPFRGISGPERVRGHPRPRGRSPSLAYAHPAP